MQAFAGSLGRRKRVPTEKSGHLAAPASHFNGLNRQAVQSSKRFSGSDKSASETGSNDEIVAYSLFVPPPAFIRVVRASLLDPNVRA